jgi:hypothetical protein
LVDLKPCIFVRAVELADANSPRDCWHAVLARANPSTQFREVLLRKISVCRLHRLFSGGSDRAAGGRQQGGNVFAFKLGINPASLDQFLDGAPIDLGEFLCSSSFLFSC